MKLKAVARLDAMMLELQSEYRTHWESAKDVIINRTFAPDCTVYVPGDPHCPALDHKAFEESLRYDLSKPSPGPRYCVVPGDLCNFDNYSRFISTGEESLAETFRVTRAFLSLLADRYEKVLYITGNHDERLLKFLSRATGGRAELMAHLIGDGAILDWPHRIQTGTDHDGGAIYSVLPRVSRVPSTFVRVHDCVIAHWRGSSTLATSARWAAEKVRSMESRGQLDGRARGVVVAHDHHVCEGVYWGGLKCMACGCLQRDADYGTFDNSPYERSGGFQRGFARLVFRDGRLDWRESRAYYYG